MTCAYAVPTLLPRLSIACDPISSIDPPALRILSTALKAALTSGDASIAETIDDNLSLITSMSLSNDGITPEALLVKSIPNSGETNPI